MLLGEMCRLERRLMRIARKSDTATREQVQALEGVGRSKRKRLDVALAREKLAVALQLKSSNDRVEGQLGGQDGGVVRRDDAPPFRVPEGPATH